MGWTSFYTDKPTRQVIIDELTFADEYGSGRVIDAATKGNTTYVAWERTYGGKRYVMGVVVLVERGGGEVCLKTITESMGPCESDCPARILNKLSPVEDFDGGEYAVAWRERCRANLTKAANKPGHGVTIKFREPIKFSNGETLDTFVIHKQGRKVRFAKPGGVPCYRISGWEKRDFDRLTS